MKIAVLTYDSEHRKSQDVLMRLAAFGYNEVQVVAQPWIENPKNHIPLISHRPGEPLWPCQPIEGLPPYKLCMRFGWSYVQREHKDFRLEDNEIGVVAGARVLPKDVTDSGIIVNAHPALLPYGRGLDSMKWCLLHGNKIGVTAHILDEQADLGYVIDSAATPIYPTDTFHAFAMRQYEQEIDLLIKSISTVSGRTKESFRKIEIMEDIEDTWDATRRMSHQYETLLMGAFEAYKRKSYGM